MNRRRTVEKKTKFRIKKSTFCCTSNACQTQKNLIFCWFVISSPNEHILLINDENETLVMIDTKQRK